MGDLFSIKRKMETVSFPACESVHRTSPRQILTPEGAKLLVEADFGGRNGWFLVKYSAS